MGRMKPSRVLAIALGTLVLGGGVARAEDLPQSPACGRALLALERAEDALAATAVAAAPSTPEAQRQRDIAMRLRPLREQVARACLGGVHTGPPPSQHSWTAPVPLRSAAAPPPSFARPSMPVPVTLPRTDAPLMLGPCNAATCLASDGSTLTRVGPQLIGPRGPCTVQGVFLRCP